MSCPEMSSYALLVLRAGPPGTNYKVMKKAFDEGWGAVIAKTVSLDSSKARPGLKPMFVMLCCVGVPAPLIERFRVPCAAP